MPFEVNTNTNTNSFRINFSIPIPIPIPIPGKLGFSIPIPIPAKTSIPIPGIVCVWYIHSLLYKDNGKMDQHRKSLRNPEIFSTLCIGILSTYMTM